MAVQGLAAVAEPNLDALLRLGLGVALALGLASYFPPPMIPQILHGAFHGVAVVAAMLASLRGDDLRARHISLWDEAAVLELLSLTAKAFIQPDAAVSASG